MQASIRARAARIREAGEAAHGRALRLQGALDAMGWSGVAAARLRLDAETGIAELLRLAQLSTAAASALERHAQAVGAAPQPAGSR